MGALLVTTHSSRRRSQIIAGIRTALSTLRAQGSEPAEVRINPDLHAEAAPLDIVEGLRVRPDPFTPPGAIYILPSAPDPTD